MYADSMDTSNSPTHVSSIDSGKWKHDKFQELERGNGRQKPTQKHFGGRNGNGFSTSKHHVENPNAITTLLVSNLAESVLQEDLEELFSEFDPEKVLLHHDAVGVSLGTATVEVLRNKVESIRKMLEDVLLDGNQIVLLETNTAGSSSQKESIFSRIQKVDSSKNKFKTSRNNSSVKHVDMKHRLSFSSSSKKPNRSKSVGNERAASSRHRAPVRREKKKKTLEELDAELEAYMRA